MYLAIDCVYGWPEELAIVRDGEIIKTGNYGLANLQGSIPQQQKNWRAGSLPYCDEL